MRHVHARLRCKVCRHEWAALIDPDEKAFDCVGCGGAAAPVRKGESMEFKSNDRPKKARLLAIEKATRAGNGYRYT